MLASVWATVGRDARVRADATLLREIRKVDIAELCRVDRDLSRVGIRRPCSGKGGTAGKGRA